MERRIAATALRQELTDVLQAVRDEQAVYIINTFNRPQAVLINWEEYNQFQRFREERAAFFNWLEETAAQNAVRNKGLSESEVLAIIEQARQEVAEAGK
jgi:prevent-host-death family protein